MTTEDPVSEGLEKVEFISPDHVDCSSQPSPPLKTALINLKDSNESECSQENGGDQEEVQAESSRGQICQIERLHVNKKSQYFDNGNDSVLTKMTSVTFTVG